MRQKVKASVLKLAKLYGFFVTFPFRISSNSVARPVNVSHEDWPGFLSREFNRPGLRVLEIGSRNVTGANFRQSFQPLNTSGSTSMPGKTSMWSGTLTGYPPTFPARKGLI